MTDIERLGRAIARRGNRFQYTMLTAWGYSRPDSWGRVLRTKCPHYGEVGHVHGGPSYDRQPCPCGEQWPKGIQ